MAKKDFDLDGDGVTSKEEIEAAKLLKEAIDAGVEVIAYNCKISPQQITINKKIPVLSY